MPVPSKISATSQAPKGVKPSFQLRIKPQAGGSMLDAALAAVIAKLAAHPYRLANIFQQLSTGLDVFEPGVLGGSASDFALAQRRGKNLIAFVVGTLLVKAYPDACRSAPDIMDVVFRALMSQRTLRAVARVLRLLSADSAVGIIQAIAGSLDSTSDGTAKAHALVVDIMRPLIGAAVRACIRFEERKHECATEATGEITVTLLKDRLPIESSPMQFMHKLFPPPSASVSAPVASGCRRSAPPKRTAEIHIEDDDAERLASGLTPAPPTLLGFKRAREEDHEEDGGAFPVADVDVDSISGNDSDGGQRQTTQPKRRADRPRKKLRSTTGGRRGKGKPCFESPEAEALRVVGEAASNAIGDALSDALPPAAVSFFAKGRFTGYGDGADSRIGHNLLQYVLTAALHNFVQEAVISLTPEAVQVALDLLMCKALRSRIARAVGVAEDLNDAYKKLDGAIGRASYQHSIEEIRQHVLAVFAPLITVALDFLSPFISPGAQPEELHHPREHLRQILRIRAHGITYDDGLTQLEALLSTDNKFAASLLNRDLLMGLEVI